MRIGFDAKRAFNNSTGLGNYSRFVISAFTRKFPENEYFLFTPAVKTEFEHFYAGDYNIRVVSPGSIIGKAFPALWRTYAIADICNELGLDVFHGLSNELPVGIERFRGRKLVTIHDLIFLRYPAYYSNIDRYIYTRKFKHACAAADLVIAASKQTGTDIEQHFRTPGQKLRVIYQNCDERFTTDADLEHDLEILQRYKLVNNYILCVGTPEARKNQMTVLKAFEMLRDDSVRLLFVGRQTEYVKQMEDFIRAHNLDKRVVILHDVATNDLPAVYRKASVFVYASDFDGFGSPVLEALRSGIPVLAADTSSLPEVGGDAARYFNYSEPAELCAHLRVLLADENKRKEMRIKGLRQAERFNTGGLMTELASAYRG